MPNPTQGDLDAALDAFDRPVPSHAEPKPVPIERAPDPEPAEPWHNEPSSAGPVARAPYVQPEPAHRLQPFIGAGGKHKTPDDFTWRECWLRITELWLKGVMDGEQYADLVKASSVWQQHGLQHPPSELLEALRARLWAFETPDNVGKEGLIERARDTPADRRVDQRAVSSDQRLHDDADRPRPDEPTRSGDDRGSGERAEQATEGAGR